MAIITKQNNDDDDDDDDNDVMLIINFYEGIKELAFIIISYIPC
jgi:hypothetical protein